MTTPAQPAVPASGDQLVDDAADHRRSRRRAGQLDNRTLGRSLGWTAAQTAESLAAAKDRLLIWGIHVGGNPGPCFEDIELTVQGRRFLVDAEA